MKQEHAEYLAGHLKGAMVAAEKEKLGMIERYLGSSSVDKLLGGMQVSAVKLESAVPHRGETEGAWGIQLMYIGKEGDEGLKQKILDMAYPAADGVRRDYVKETGDASWETYGVCANEVVFRPLDITVKVGGLGQLQVSPRMRGE